MIRLDTTTRKLQALLGGSITTNQLPITVCWSDKTSTTYSGGATVNNTNNTTAVDICAAPAASTIRDIDTINVNNADTVTATITIRYNDNGTTYVLFKAQLATGDQLTYAHGDGWKVLDSAGVIKSFSPTDLKLSSFAPTTSAELATVITDETGTGALVFANTPTLVTPILGVASGTSLNLASGAVGSPSLYLNSETTSGLYRIGANNHGWAISGAKVLDISSTGLGVVGKATATTTFESGSTGNLGRYSLARSTDGAFVSYITLTGAGAAPTLDIYNGVASATNIYSAGAIVGAFSSTGLSVTGTLSSTGAGTIASSSGSSLFLKDSGLSTQGTVTFGTTLGYNVQGGSDYGGNDYNVPTGGLHRFRVNAAQVGEFSSTGLAVTGALSATDQLTVTKSGQAALFNGATGTYATWQYNGTSVGDIGTADEAVGGSTADFGITSRSGNLVFGTGSVERMRIDSSGNLGLGVTPSAWRSNYRALELGRVGNYVSGTTAGVVELGLNAYVDSGNQYRYANNGAASVFYQTGGEYRFFTAPSGTAGNTITFTQAMTLDAAGSFTLATAGPHAIGGATTASVQWHQRGTFAPSGGGTGIALNIAPAITLEANTSGMLGRFNGTLTEAGSGTHPILAGLYIDPTITAGSASVTEYASIYLPSVTVQSTTTTASTIYIAGAPTGATNNYALWVDAGTIRFDGTTGAGANTGTLTNAPSTGNPAYWMPVNANGTTYYVPCWT